MTRQHAKEILSLYRPGTADANDPAFAEALASCEDDRELKLWFTAHCDTYNALRSRFREISAPEGLKEQILAERIIHTKEFVWRKPAMYAAITVLAVLTVILTIVWQQPREETGLRAFRNRMVGAGLLNYRMDLETNDLTEIRQFLARKNSEADFAVPPNLERNARTTGCALLAWQGKRVSMICFHSGKPLGPGESSDLFLFITDSSRTPGAPASTTPSVEKISRATTACWTDGGKTYLLVAAGDEEFLRKYL